MKEEMEVFHIACSTDDKYIHHCCALFCSLLENHKNVSLQLHLLTESLADQHIALLRRLVSSYPNASLHIHYVVTDRLEYVKYRQNRPLSKAAYYRLLLASVLDRLDKVVYLDTDMIVVGDLIPLFQLDIENYALAAVRDVTPCSDEHRMQLSISYQGGYFCSALMLINLVYWRQHQAEDRLLAFAKRERKVFCHDQDALNFVFKQVWFELPPKWNKFHLHHMPCASFPTWQDRYEYRAAPMVIHFSSYNPFERCYFIPYNRLYWKYLKLSGYDYQGRFQKSSFWNRIRPALGYYGTFLLNKIHIYPNRWYWRLSVGSHLVK